MILQAATFLLVMILWTLYFRIRSLSKQVKGLRELARLQLKWNETIDRGSGLQAEFNKAVVELDKKKKVLDDI